MREVEMIYCLSDQTWYTDTIEIPSSTPDDSIESVACDIAQGDYGPELVYVGVYYIEPDHEEE